MSDLLSIYKELRPEFIKEIFKEITSDLPDIEYKILPTKTIPRDYVDIATVKYRNKPMSIALPDTPYPLIQPDVTGEVKRVTGFHFKEGISILASEIQALSQADPTYKKIYLIDKLEYLKTRANIRIKQIFWDALRGNISVTENGITYSYTYPITTGSVSASWANPSTNIIKDLETNIDLLSNEPVQPKYLIMNKKTYGYFKYNNNISSLLATAGILTKEDGIKKLISDLGLEILIVNSFYVDTNNNKHKFVNDDEVFIIFEGDNPLGYIYLLADENTATLDRPGTPGFWTETIDRTNDNPRRYDIVAGVNFFPAIFNPSWIVRIADVTI